MSDNTIVYIKRKGGIYYAFHQSIESNPIFKNAIFYTKGLKRIIDKVQEYCRENNVEYSYWFV